MPFNEYSLSPGFELVERAMNLVDDETSDAASVLSKYAWLLAARGRSLGETLPILDHSIDIARSLGDGEAEAWATNRRAQAFLMNLEWTKSLEVSERAIELARANGALSAEGIGYLSTAWSFGALGRSEEANERLKRCVEVAEALGLTTRAT